MKRVRKLPVGPLDMLRTVSSPADMRVVVVGGGGVGNGDVDPFGEVGFSAVELVERIGSELEALRLIEVGRGMRLSTVWEMDPEAGGKARSTTVGPAPFQVVVVTVVVISPETVQSLMTCGWVVAVILDDFDNFG